MFCEHGRRNLVLLFVAAAVAGCAPRGPDLANVLLTIKKEILLATICPQLIGTSLKTPPMFELSQDVVVKLKTQVTVEGRVEVVPATFGSIGGLFGNVETQEIIVTLTPLAVSPGEITITKTGGAEKITGVKAIASLPRYRTGEHWVGNYLGYIGEKLDPSTGKEVPIEGWLPIEDVQKIEVMNPGDLDDEAKQELAKECQRRFGPS
ncbi:MAG: hypothetical protein IIC53_01160 [Proteobacteria bacterium]|nr:hypothetical protein [Pseudomonadota bacterium]